MFLRNLEFVLGASHARSSNTDGGIQSADKRDAARAISHMALVVSFTIAGCVSAEVESGLPATGDLPVRATAPDGVSKTVVLWTGDSESRKSVRCIQNAMKAANPDFRFVSTQSWRDALFPWFETQTAPGTDAEMAALFKSPLVHERVKSLKLDYFIRVSAATVSSGDLKGRAIKAGKSGAIACGHTGCIGLAFWDRETKITARVWHLESAAMVGEIGAQATGTAVMPAFILPIPFIPPTKGTACNKMARSLSAYLSGAANGAKTE